MSFGKVFLYFLFVLGAIASIINMILLGINFQNQMTERQLNINHPPMNVTMPASKAPIVNVAASRAPAVNMTAPVVNITQDPPVINVHNHGTAE